MLKSLFTGRTASSTKSQKTGSGIRFAVFTEFSTFLLDWGYLGLYVIWSKPHSRLNFRNPLGANYGPLSVLKAARFAFFHTKCCSFHGYCIKFLKLQREARRSEKRPEGQFLVLLALQRRKKRRLQRLQCEKESEVEVVKFRFFFFFLEERNFSANEDLSSGAAFF